LNALQAQLGENMTRIEILKSALKDQIGRFDSESRKHKRLHRRLRTMVFVLAAATTILSSAAIGFLNQQKTVNLIIVVISATIGVLTSIEGMRKPGELWIHERTILYALKDLALEVDYTTSGADSTEEIDPLFVRMLDILGGSLQRWNSKVAPEELAKIIKQQQAVAMMFTEQTDRPALILKGDDELVRPRDLEEE